MFKFLLSWVARCLVSLDLCLIWMLSFLVCRRVGRLCRWCLWRLVGLWCVDIRRSDFAFLDVVLRSWVASRFGLKWCRVLLLMGLCMILIVRILLSVFRVIRCGIGG